MELESHIEGKVVTWAKKRGWLTPKVKFAENGYPDRLFISPNGHTIFLEFKRPGEVPEPIQVYRINELKRRSIPAYWCDSVFEALSILAAAMESETLPGTSNITPIRAGVGRTLFGSRPREDLRNPSDLQDFEGEGIRQEAPADSSDQADVQGLAGRDPEVE